MHTPELISIEELGQALSVSKATAWRIVNGGEIPCIEVSRGRVMVDRADVHQFVTDRKRRRGGREAPRVA